MMSPTGRAGTGSGLPVPVPYETPRWSSWSAASSSRLPSRSVVPFGGLASKRRWDRIRMSRVLMGHGVA